MPAPISTVVLRATVAATSILTVNTGSSVGAAVVGINGTVNVVRREKLELRVKSIRPCCTVTNKIVFDVVALNFVHVASEVAVRVDSLAETVVIVADVVAINEGDTVVKLRFFRSVVELHSVPWYPASQTHVHPLTRSPDTDIALPLQLPAFVHGVAMHRG